MLVDYEAIKKGSILLKLISQMHAPFKPNPFKVLDIKYNFSCFFDSSNNPIGPHTKFKREKKMDIATLKP